MTHANSMEECLLIVNSWSEAARKAALEARKQGGGHKEQNEAVAGALMGKIHERESATRATSSRHTTEGKLRQVNRQPTLEASSAHKASEKTLKVDQGAHAKKAAVHSKAALDAHREDDPRAAGSAHFKAADAHEAAAKEHSGFFGSRTKRDAHLAAAKEHKRAGAEAIVEHNDRHRG